MNMKNPVGSSPLPSVNPIIYLKFLLLYRFMTHLGLISIKQRRSVCFRLGQHSFEFRSVSSIHERWCGAGLISISHFRTISANFRGW